MSSGADDNLSDLVQWPPPKLPRQGSFFARVTHVTENGQIYLQECEDRHDIVRMTRETTKIEKKKAARDSSSSASRTWTVGDAALLFWSGDKSWHRVQIVVRSRHQCGVKFVDTGHVANVDPNQLRRPSRFCNTEMKHIRVILDHLLPPGNATEWSDSTLDLIYKSVHFESAGMVRVTVTKPDVETFPLPVTIKFYHLGRRRWQDLSELLVNSSMASHTSCLIHQLHLDRFSKEAFNIQPGGRRVPATGDLKELPEPAENDATSEEGTAGIPVSPFTPRTRVLDGQKFFTVETSPVILDNGDIFVCVEGHAYRTMARALNSAVHNTSSCRPARGDALAVKYGGNYYRATCLTSIGAPADGEHGTLFVHFTDIGDVDEVPLADVSILPQHFLKLPPFAVEVNLPYHYRRANKHYYIQKIVNKLSAKDPGDTLVIRNITPGVVLTGELYFRRGGRLVNLLVDEKNQGLLSLTAI